MLIFNNTGLRHTPQRPTVNPAYLVSQLTFDGTNGSTTFTDAVPGKTWNVVGNTQIVTSTSVSGGASVYFDGAGDRLYSTHADYALGTDDFTIEFRMNLINYGSLYYRRLVQIGPNTTNGGLWIVTVKGSNLLFVQTYNSGSYWNAIEPFATPVATWCHLALCRKNGRFFFMVDGRIRGIGTGGPGNNITQTTLSLGANTSNGEPLYGYLDDFRLIKGQALYTYNRPMSPYPYFAPNPINP